MGNHLPYKKVVGFCARILPANIYVKLSNKLMKKDQNINCDYFINAASQYNYKIQTMPKDWYLPATYLNFEGKKYMVPAKYHKILERVFKDYMKLPPEEKGFVIMQ